MKLKDGKFLAIYIYPEEYKEIGIDANKENIDVRNDIREKLGLPRRSGRSGYSIQGLMKKKNYSEEEKKEIFELMNKKGVVKEE